MPIVTTLEVKQGKKECVSLFLDDEFTLEIPLIQAANLRRGQNLSDAEVQGLIDESVVVKAFDKAINLLSIRPRSIEEVRRRLARAGFADSVVAAAIDRLREQRYVDDLAFARFWIENREAFKPMSPRAIAHELYQKGVERDVYDALLEAIDVEDAAYRSSKKQIWRYRGKMRYEFKTRLTAMLRRRGFDFDTISRVVLRLECELNESQPDFFAGDD